MGSFLLYGANGYTGTLIAKLASEYGLRPILAARREEAVKPLADSLNLDYRVFDLSHSKKLEDTLREVQVVLHAAGPFSQTSRPMIDACLRTHTHYLDITGEIGVFEMAKNFDSAARDAGIMLMPGVGFDVVPTDCLALFLHQQMSDAHHLKLAFGSVGGGYSRGTAITMAQGAGEKSAERRNGVITLVPLGHRGMKVDFGLKELFVMSIPWGDVSTAYTTTGIPNIVTYTAASPKTYKMLKYQSLFNWILRTSMVRKWQINKIKSGPAGPSDEKRARSKSLVWGEVTNPAGAVLRARLNGPEGYTLTAHSSLIITRKVIEKNFKSGYQTPAGCYGADLVLDIPGMFRELC